MPLWTLCVRFGTRSVPGCIPTQSVGTIIERRVSPGCLVGAAPMLNTLLPILLFAALGLALLGALRRMNMWRRGRAAKVDLLGGLLAMPKRYMIDLHHVVARDKYIANTHVATAG